MSNAQMSTKVITFVTDCFRILKREVKREKKSWFVSIFDRHTHSFLSIWLMMMKNRKPYGMAGRRQKVSISNYVTEQNLKTDRAI